MARTFAFESRSFIVRRKCVRHSVTMTVNTMYTSSASTVMTVNQMSYLSER